MTELRMVLVGARKKEVFDGEEKWEMKTSWKGLRFLSETKAKDLLIFQFNIDREFV